MTRSTPWTMIFLALGGLSFGASCGDDDDDDVVGTGGTQAGGSAGTGGAGQLDLTDAQVASVIRAANAGEIGQAQAALPELQDEDAREFAQEMIDEHGTANSTLDALLDGANITPVSNPLTVQLELSSQAIIADIEAAAPADVDRVYIDAQVLVHEMVLTLIDDELVPDTDSAALRIYLTAARTTVQEHRDEAVDIQSDLNAGGAAGAGGTGGSGVSGVRRSAEGRRGGGRLRPSP